MFHNFERLVHILWGSRVWLACTQNAIGELAAPLYWLANGLLASIWSYFYVGSAEKKDPF